MASSIRELAFAAYEPQVYEWIVIFRARKKN